MIKTSTTHPLRIDFVVTPGRGLIGMTFCPGKKQRDALHGTWDRDLELDLDEVCKWDAVGVVTLMEDHELTRYQVACIGAAVAARGMTWYHLPIEDGGVPSNDFAEAWCLAGAALRTNLANGSRIVLHCRGGLGRTGTIAAQLLVELGVDANDAITNVRAARPGAIENTAQEAYVRSVVSPATAGLRDRARGALLGLAVGDALGTTLEFSCRDAATKHIDMTGGGPFKLEPGQWTDDTSMALALADSLLQHGEFNAVDLMDRFVAWRHDGRYSCTGHCFDIGITTSRALDRFLETDDPFAGDTSENAAGNGSLMRLSPVALHCLDDPKKAARVAAEQSRTTHAAPQAIEACVWFADLLRRAIHGESKQSLLRPSAWGNHPAMQQVASGTWRGRKRSAVRSSGYVIDTIEAALWAVDETENFEDALVLAVNLGNDSDTVGAVTGQLAGALYGEAAIPSRWLGPLAWKSRISDIADALIGQRRVSSHPS
jgi:ADP-ribosyl-[dinitrogen reductase] hydrolase